ncbi:MAG: hemolysin family protein [candidate division WOR-3 bacterium]
MIHHYLLIILLLACSAFFSGMEAAIFSLSKFRVKSLLFENIKGAHSLSHLKNEPFNTLFTLLFMNDLVNIGASSLATVIITHILLKLNLAPVFFYPFEIFLMTFLLLLLGEITPKTVFLNNAEYLALRLSFIVEILNKLTFPLATLFSNILRTLTPTPKGFNISEEDIKKMLTEAKAQNILEEVEVQLTYRILKFGKTLVHEIMIPADKVIGVREQQSVIEAMELMKKTRHSRICVYKSSEPNEVIGVLYAKDLILKEFTGQEKVTLCMRSPFVIPKTEPIDELLIDFRKKGIHFAVINDENGKFVGIVTLNDILKYLFGTLPEI